MKSKKTLLLNSILLLALIVSLSYNQIMLAKIQNKLGIKILVSSSFWQVSGSSSLSGDVVQDAINIVVSQGVPLIYGQELAISFDEVQQSINVLRQFDPTYGKQKIILAGNDLQRFIDVGLQISCEYCCSAKSIIRADGQAACGCAHSQAMRGLMAYLIQNHGLEYTDDEILRELARWKGMYFPKQMIAKLTNQFQGTDFTPDTASLVLGIDLPDYGQGNKSAPLPSDLKNLPNMVGGC